MAHLELDTNLADNLRGNNGTNQDKTHLLSQVLSTSVSLPTGNCIECERIQVRGIEAIKPHLEKDYRGLRILPRFYVTIISLSFILLFPYSWS